jgi:hypothetical protein
MPGRYRDLVRGEEVPCWEAGARAYARSAQGALLELIDTVVYSRKLAVLALHPHDPDAMGLHVTLFDVRCLTGRFVEQDHGLCEGALEPWRCEAESRNALLLICVGATEEVFTQCSQNLFVRRPLPEPEARFRAAQPKGWRPDLPLERLLDAQFEMFQVTVSASGLPGASPRNGDRGKTAFIERRNSKTGRVQTRVTLSWSESISDTRFPLFFRNEYRHDFIPVGRGQSVQRCSQGPCNFIAVES